MTGTSSIVDSIMARLSHEGLDAYEVYMTRSNGLTIEIKDGVIDVFVKSENAGISLRVSNEQRLGFTFSTDLSPKVIPVLIERVVHGASATDRDPFVGFPLPSARTLPQFDQFDHDLERISVEDKIERTRSLEAAARSSDPRINRVRKAAYVETTGTVTICNHTGLKLSYPKTLVWGSIMVVAEEGENTDILKVLSASFMADNLTTFRKGNLCFLDEGGAGLFASCDDCGRRTLSGRHCLQPI